MNKTATQHNWSSFLTFFSRQNRHRPTRIGVFEGVPGAMTDYWLEDGLPLEGIDVDTRGSDAPTIEIMLGSNGNPERGEFTHKIARALFLRIILSASGESDGLDIEDENGATTVLRFENNL
jgi:hypothetical protein